MPKVDREVPWCSIILVFAALSCHTLVLYGNLETASAMQTLGSSTGGWSRVGTGLARSFRDELDVLMGDIGDKLSDALNQTVGVQKYIDIVVSLVGNATEAAGQEAVLLQESSQSGTLPDTILAGVNQTMVVVLAKLTTELDTFLLKIKPALEKAGQMIIKFGDKITQVLESFSQTLDTVQKMFDQIMAQLNSNKRPEIKEEMIHDTYTLFDVSNTGFINEADLTEAAEIYSVSALQGTKPKELMEKYDRDGDNRLDKNEFTLFVDDPSIPKAMAVILRAYAKRLSAVAGNVAAARKRDEVALAVTKYFQLVCAKNKTKLVWVSDALGNGSLPLEFTADIFKTLAQQVDNPDVLTTADVGQVVISTMMELHPKQVMKAVDLLAKTEFWVEEGFDPKDQPLTLQRVTKWVGEAKRPRGKALLSIMDENFISEETLDAMPAMAAMLAEENVARHQGAQFSACATRRQALFSTESSQYLLRHLLGGVAASDAVDGASEAAQRAINAGVPARPETLMFAKFLSWNASATADRFQKQSFEYTSESSSALDSFANQIQGMIKKITSFIRMAEKYATPAGIARLEKEIQGFAVHAGADMMKVVNKKLETVVRKEAPKLQAGINGAVAKVGNIVSEKVEQIVAGPLIDAMKAPVEQIVGEALHNPESGKVIGDMLGDTVGKEIQNITGKVIGDKIEGLLNNSINEAIEKADNAVAEMTPPGSSLLETGTNLETFDEMVDMQEGLNGAFDKMSTLLRTMVKFIPQAGDTMKFAKQEVGEAAKVMDSVFNGFEMKGPSIFNNIAALWKTLWSLYFVFLLPMTVGLLFYAFWASGYLGGPQAPGSTAPDVGPMTLSHRLCNCCSACSFCMTSYHDTQLCFWSCIILFQVVCLLIFVISLVLCILGGVKSFVLEGCSQVYVLEDDGICLETVGVLRKFLDSFHVGEAALNLASVCADNRLLTCDLIATKMKSSTIYTSLFSLLAALFSFQMIIESAMLHTRARYRRMIDAIDKDASYKDDNA